MKAFLYLFFPVSLCFLTFLTGLYFLWFSKRKKIAHAFIGLTFFLFLLFGNQLFSYAVLKPLEYKYPPIESSKKFHSIKESIKYVVVLGGSPRLSPSLPITSRINRTVLARFVEGIRVQKMLPSTKIILSGGSRAAETMQEMALALDFSPNNLILETESANTYEEAIFLKRILQNQPFILVTSARHMPRSMALFKHAGLHPIAAPTGHLTFPHTSWSFSFSILIPTPESMEKCHEAFYEYLGLIKEYFLGHI